MDRTDELLEQILVELQGLRTEVAEIQQVIALPIYNADDMHSEIVAMKDAIEDIAERVTGPLGYHLGDLHSLSSEMLDKLTMVEINTAP